MTLTLLLNVMVENNLLRNWFPEGKSIRKTSKQDNVFEFE